MRSEKAFESCSLDPDVVSHVFLNRSSGISGAGGSGMPSTVYFDDIDASQSYFPPGVSENPDSPYFTSSLDTWESAARGETTTPLAPLSWGAQTFVEEYPVTGEVGAV